VERAAQHDVASSSVDLDPATSTRPARWSCSPIAGWRPNHAVRVRGGAASAVEMLGGIKPVGVDAVRSNSATAAARLGCERTRPNGATSAVRSLLIAGVWSGVWRWFHHPLLRLPSISPTSRDCCWFRSWAL
jgi:hypothetical protein